MATRMTMIFFWSPLCLHGLFLTSYALWSPLLTVYWWSGILVCLGVLFWRSHSTRSKVSQNFRFEREQNKIAWLDSLNLDQSMFQVKILRYRCYIIVWKLQNDAEVATLVKARGECKPWILSQKWKLTCLSCDPKTPPNHIETASKYHRPSIICMVDCCKWTPSSNEPSFIIFWTSNLGSIQNCDENCLLIKMSLYFHTHIALCCNQRI